MREQLLQDLKEAMKQKDKERLAVIRMLKGAMQLEEIKLQRELNDDEIITIIAKQIKTRKESIQEFKKGGRDDLIDTTNREIAILSPYLPEQLSEEEVMNIIDQTIAEVQPASMKDMGKLMGVITPKVKGKADLGLVSRIIREKLNQ